MLNEFGLAQTLEHDFNVHRTERDLPPPIHMVIDERTALCFLRVSQVTVCRLNEPRVAPGRLRSCLEQILEASDAFLRAFVIQLAQQCQRFKVMWIIVEARGAHAAMIMSRYNIGCCPLMPRF